MGRGRSSSCAPFGYRARAGDALVNGERVQLFGLGEGAKRRGQIQICDRERFEVQLAQAMRAEKAIPPANRFMRYAYAAWNSRQSEFARGRERIAHARVLPEKLVDAGPRERCGRVLLRLGLDGQSVYVRQGFRLRHARHHETQEAHSGRG